MSSTIFFLGRLVGALLSGPLADKFGRRPVFFCSIVAQVVLGCAAAASPTLWFFYGVYFLQGCVQVSVYLTSFVLGTELVGPRYRKNAGMCKQFFYSGGQIILTGLAFWLRKWRYILVVISLAPMLFFSYYWLLPESVRWLLAKGRKEEAEKIIKKTAYYNKVTLDDNIIDQLDLEEEKNTHKTYTFIDILRTATIAKIAVNVWFIWFVNALIYYGLSLNSSKLHGDPYLNFLFLACVEIPAVALCIPLLDRVGRRYLMLIFMLIGAVGCFGTAIFLGHPYLPVVFSTMGKFGITASYAIIYLFTAEVFPTVLRNNGIGIASVCARIAGIVAPLCLRLSVVWSPLSMVVFGAVSTIGGLCCLILPETTGKPLTQDIEEMKIVFNLERNNIHSGDKMKSVEEVDKLNNPVAA